MDQGAERIAYIGQTNFRRQRVRFGLHERDRLSHVYAIGKTGVGKSTLLATLALQDITAGGGAAVIDPHCDLVERVYALLPPAERDGTIYLNAPDPLQPYGYNPLRRVKALATKLRHVRDDRAPHDELAELLKALKIAPYAPARSALKESLESEDRSLFSQRTNDPWTRDARSSHWEPRSPRSRGSRR